MTGPLRLTGLRVGVGHVCRFVFLAGGLVLSVAMTGAFGRLSGQTTARRGLTVDDILAMQEIGDVTPSPIGDMLAIEVKRPSATGEVYDRFAGGWDRSDIWLVSVNDGSMRNLTHGRTDTSGYWRPVWSPDGMRLAMLSTRTESATDGDVHVYVWNRRTDSLERVSQRTVALPVFSTPSLGAYPTLLSWADTSTLVVALLPAGTEVADFEGPHGAERTAERGWTAFRFGATNTASVLESGAEHSSLPGPIPDLVQIDVSTHLERGLVTVPGLRAVELSPNLKRAVIFEDTSAILPNASARPHFALRSGRFGVWTLDEPSTIHWISDVAPQFDRFVAATSALWQWSSANPNVVALFEPVTHGRDSVAHVWVTDLKSGSSVCVDSGLHSISGTFWTRTGQLLVHGIRSTTNLSGGVSGWFVVWPGHTTSPVWPDSAHAPAELAPVGQSAVYGVNGDAVWQRSLAEPGRASKRLTESVAVTEVVNLPDNRVSSPGAQASVPVVMRLGGTAEPHTARFALLRISNKTLMSPYKTDQVPPQTELKTVIVQPNRDPTLLLEATDSSGTALWLVSTDRPERRLLDLNRHLSAVAIASRKFFVYLTDDGRAATGTVLLPMNYQRGQRYPVICDVYGGDEGGTPSDTVTHQLQSAVIDGGAFDDQLLTAHGFVVLAASIPLTPLGQPGEPFLEHINGVLPAVQELVRLGIADSSRIGLLGRSYGGYGVVSLLTYSHWFRAAAVISSAPVDLVSAHGGISGSYRYRDDVLLDPLGTLATWVEAWQGHMGVTLQNDPMRYVRNSPLFYLDRVQAPLLIIEGDQDLSMNQSDELFANLYRLGKRARYVRYWGEPHGVNSPANIRHMWGELLSWYDRYLSPN